MNNDNERLINKYIGFIIKHFNLTNETVDSLKKKFDYRFETKTRVSFKKNRYAKAQSLCRLVDRKAHAKVVDVLTRYSDYDTFAEYMKNLKGDYVIVSVEDEGIGIAENEYLHAFDKFAQIENSLSRKAGGTGLGLPIARQLLEAHNGAIWCDSVLNKGSNFHFAIPVDSANIKSEEILV